MPNHDDPRLRFSGQADDPAAPDEATFRLGAPDADADSWADADEPTRATVLDPASWSSEVPQAAAPPAFVPAPAYAAVPVPVSLSAPEVVPQPPDHSAPARPTGGLRRFGPGVPGPDASAGTAQTAAVWHGTVRPGEPVLPAGAGKRRGRALRGWLLPVVVLLVVLAFLAWQRFPASVKVDGVSVRSSGAVQGCHSTARIIGTLRTSGGAGTVRYRWRRSDGTVSDELKQHVAKGHRSTDVPLLWTFDGPGSLTATATLEVLGPQQRSASTTFRYRCG